MEKQSLSLAEKERRYTLVRKEMAAQQLDGLLVYGDSGKWDQRSDNLRCGLRGSEFPVLKPKAAGATVGEKARSLYERVARMEVKKGMVFAFEPQAIDRGGRGIHFGDPIAVTRNGCERLSELSLDLVVV